MEILARLSPARSWLARLLVAASILTSIGESAVAQEQLWLQQFGSSASDTPRATVSDAAGGVFLVGSTFGDLGGQSAGLSDVWIARFSDSGAQLWLQQLGTFASEGASGAAEDDSGGVFVAGSTEGSLASQNLGKLDAFVARFDGSGAMLWSQQFGTTQADQVNAVASNATGGVWVCGDTAGDLGGPNLGVLDAWLVKFDSSGSVLWKKQIGTTTFDTAIDVARGPQGSVYVCGITSGNLGSQNVGKQDVWLARYDSNGALVWMRQFGSDQDEDPRSIVADETGRVYVCGWTSGILNGASHGGDDAYIAAYSPVGDALWLSQIGTNGYDVANAITLRDSSQMYVAGLTSGNWAGAGAGGFDAWFARVDSTGQILWTEQIGTAQSDHATTLSPGSQGTIYVGGLTQGALGTVNAGASDTWLARYDGACNSGTTYCTTSATSIPGCQASIGGSGSPSLSYPTAYSIDSGPVPGGSIGLLLFGSSGTDNTPYGTLGGLLCVASPNFRSAPQLGGGDQGLCNGSYAFTLQDLISAAPVVIPGAVIDAQVWARDPANQDGFLLSDGLVFTVCP